MNTLLNFLLRLVLFAAGLVFVLAFAAAALLLLGAWSLRLAWARLTGRPVTPWATRIDPRAAWDWTRRQARPEPSVRPRDLADVTDVEAKPPRSP